MLCVKLRRGSGQQTAGGGDEDMHRNFGVNIYDLCAVRLVENLA